tara:strand:- start:373 stop:648 length:276 start_codon:yes stop_codon:yes gene_type:complete
MNQENLNAGTSSTLKDVPFTMENLIEAKALLQALAPKQAPPGVGMINFGAGLKIMKSDMMPSHTIMVSKDLFDKLFACAEQSGTEHPTKEL